MLARNAGQVVLREDLLARLWPNAVVTDESLSRCIYELRRQLSLAGGDERYKAMFETVPKRGYRLNAQVTPIAPAVAEPPARRSRGAVAVACRRDRRRDRHRACGLVHARPPAGDEQPAATGRGAVLAGRAAIRRPERGTGPGAFLGWNLRGDPQPAEQDPDPEGDRAHVVVLVPGTGRRASRTSPRSSTSRTCSKAACESPANRLRITARLVEAASNSQVWSKTYDREIGDLFAVQDDIAGEVAGALNATLGEPGPAQFPTWKPTTSSCRGSSSTTAGRRATSSVP